MSTSLTSSARLQSLVAGPSLPRSTLARLCTEFVRDTASELLFNHSSRVYLFATSTGLRKGVAFDPDLLYVAAMFHDLGLTDQFSSATERFEVDGANAARAFLTENGISEQDIYEVWSSIALYTTPGIPSHMHPVVALLTSGVEMDVLGINYDAFAQQEREQIVEVFPRSPEFKEDIIQAFYQGLRHKPETTFGNVKADVIGDKDRGFTPVNFCDVIRSSAWKS
jgi:hypothetical protein